MEILFASLINFNVATCVGPLETFCPRCIVLKYMAKSTEDWDWGEFYLPEQYKRI